MKKRIEGITQFSFTISPIANELVPFSQVPVTADVKNPDWTTISATGLLAAAGMADFKDRSESHSVFTEEAEDQQLAMAAGTFLHAAEEGHYLLDRVRPRRKPFLDDFHSRVDNIGRLLPTATQAEIRQWQYILNDRRLALEAGDQGPAVDNCLNIVDGKLVDNALERPPFTDSFPLWPGDQTQIPPFVNPQVLEKRWHDEIIPSLKEKLDNLRRWEKNHPPKIGSESSRSSRGSIIDLPEVNLNFIIPPLGITVIRRSDRLTRMHLGNDKPYIVHETDLKSAETITPPKEGSNSETAMEFLTYIMTAGIIAGRLEQKETGSPLKIMIFPTPEAPLTISPTDMVSVNYVAVGGKKSQTIDFAKVYRRFLTDPTRAAELLEQASDLLDRIRRDPELRSMAEVKHRKK